MEHATSVGLLESCTPAGIRGENNDMQLTVYGIFQLIGCRLSIEWRIASPREKYDAHLLPTPVSETERLGHGRGSVYIRRRRYREDRPDERNLNAPGYPSGVTSAGGTQLRDLDLPRLNRLLLYPRARPGGP